MGFTFILLLAYLALTGLAVITFRSGRKALGGGVLRSLAMDKHGKALSSALLEMEL